MESTPFSGSDTSRGILKPFHLARDLFWLDQIIRVEILYKIA
ncbi:MAG TPA: hypothetical protein VIY49_14855 [Bryobacteraceae bacterium]